MGTLLNVFSRSRSETHHVGYELSGTIIFVCTVAPDTHLILYLRHEIMTAYRNNPWCHRGVIGPIDTDLKIGEGISFRTPHDAREPKKPLDSLCAPFPGDVGVMFRIMPDHHQNRVEKPSEIYAYEKNLTALGRVLAGRNIMGVGHIKTILEVKGGTTHFTSH